MNNAPTKISESKFNEIYTDEQFRNEVAHAHGHYDQHHNFKYKATCSYPQSYIVEESHILEAKRLKAVQRYITKRKAKGKLLFWCMGGDFEPVIPDDIANHRVRAEFKNLYGNTYFIEVIKGANNKWSIEAKTANKIFITYSIDRDLEKQRECERMIAWREYHDVKSSCKNVHQINEALKKYRETDKQDYYRAKNLEGGTTFEYSKKNLLRIVNDVFDCAFKEVVVDKYNIGCEGLLSVSPDIRIMEMGL